MKVLELSEELNAETYIFQETGTGYSDPAFHMRTWIDIDDPTPAGGSSEYSVSLMQIGAHLGTHIDAPRHFDNDGLDLKSLKRDWLVGWAVRIVIPEAPNAADCERLQKMGSSLQRREIPVIWWEGTLPAEVVDVLVGWSCPLIVLAGTGIDHPQNAKKGHYPNYRRLMQAGKFLVVDLKDGDRIKSGDFLVIAPPRFRLAELEASPCRVFAVRDLYVPWFEVEQVKGVKGVYSIAEPGHAEYVRSYLVLGEKNAALIDTGTGIDNIRRVVERLTDLEVEVVLTHTHWDHIGNAHRFDKIWVWNGPGQLQRLIEGIPHQELEDGMRAKHFGRPTPPEFNRAAFAIPRLPASCELHMVEDGAKIDLGNRVLKVIHTPGHSPDSICLLDEENRLLFAGDTFYYGPLYGYPDEFDLERYQETAEKLARLATQVDHVFPGHNEIEWDDQPMSGADLETLWDFMQKIKQEKPEAGMRRICKAERFSVEIEGV